MAEHSDHEREDIATLTIPTDLAGMVRFGAASGDFNPIHYDRDAARATGLDDVILPGLLKAGWLAGLAVEAMPDGWVLEEFEVTYRSVDLVGRPYLLGGSREVTGDAAVLDLWGGSEDGRKTTLGHASFRRLGC